MVKDWKKENVRQMEIRIKAISFREMNEERGMNSWHDYRVLATLTPASKLSNDNAWRKEVNIL